MANSVVITVLIGNFFSLLLFWIIYREIKHCMQSQIYVIGENERRIVESFDMKLLLFVYFLGTIALGIFSYFAILV